MKYCLGHVCVYVCAFDHVRVMCVCEVFEKCVFERAQIERMSEGEVECVCVCHSVCVCVFKYKWCVCVCN
jgi:hypothetical protein